MSKSGKMKAGGAFIEITGDSTEFDRAITRVEKRFDAFAASAGKIGFLFSGLGAAFSAPLGLAVRDFARFGDSIDKMSGRTGSAAEDISAIGYAAERSGSSLESLDKAAKGLYSSMDAARRGSREAKDAFAMLGMEAKSLAGLPLSKQLRLIADGMSRMTREEDKAAVAAKIFGRAGYELLPMLKAGSKGIDGLMKRAKELGVVLSQEGAASAAALRDIMDDVGSATHGLNASIGAALAPMVTVFANLSIAVMAFLSRFIKAHPIIVQTTAAVGLFVAAVGSASLAMAGFAKSSALMMVGLKKLLVPLAAAVIKLKALAVAAWANPFGLLVAGAIAAVAAVSLLYGKLSEKENTRQPDERLVSDRTEGLLAISKQKGKSGFSKETIVAEYEAQAAAIKNQLQGMNVKSSLPEGFPTVVRTYVKWLSDDNAATYKNLTEELTALENAIREIKSEGFDIIDSQSPEQIARFNAVLDETVKKILAIDEARTKKKRDSIFKNMIDLEPDAAAAVIGEQADAARNAEHALRRRIEELKTEAVEASGTEMADIQEELDSLAGSLSDVARAADEMDEWRRRAAAAVEDVKKRAGSLSEALAKFDSDNLAKAQEAAFRNLIDSGNWHDANDAVLAEMVALENEWARNTAHIADMIQEAAAGNIVSMEKAEKLFEQRRDLSGKIDRMEGKKRDVAGARDTAAEARLQVMSRMDRDRFHHEIERMGRELQNELEQAFAKATEAESRNGDASAEYLSANRILEKLQGLEKFGMDADKMAGSLLGGTYSGEAARRMNSGGGADELARKHLESSHNIEKKLDTLNRTIERAADGGGMGS